MSGDNDIFCGGPCHPFHHLKNESALLIFIVRLRMKISLGRYVVNLVKVTLVASANGCVLPWSSTSNWPFPKWSESPVAFIEERDGRGLLKAVRDEGEERPHLPI